MMIATVYAKCDDRCHVVLHDDGRELKEHDGYVPRILGGDSDGLYLRIDLQTGRILDWVAPTLLEIQDFVRGTP